MIPLVHPHVAPIVSIVVGCIVLIYPKVVNYVIGIYFILAGVLQLAH